MKPGCGSLLSFHLLPIFGGGETPPGHLRRSLLRGLFWGCVCPHTRQEILFAFCSAWDLKELGRPGGLLGPARGQASPRAGQESRRPAESGTVAKLGARAQRAKPGHVASNQPGCPAQLCPLPMASGRGHLTPHLARTGSAARHGVALHLNQLPPSRQSR